MPTITLSWTDLALFGLTAGLIGGVVLVGRSVSMGSQLVKPSSKHAVSAGNSSAKKKKNRAKKATGTVHQPTTPPTELTNGLLPSVPSTEQALSPKSIPQMTLARVNEQQSAKRKSHPQEGSHRPQSVNDAEFPPLAVANSGKSAATPKSNPKRPLAERKQAPVRKTKVDDMIDEEIEKPLKMARVMAIVDPEPESAPVLESDLEDGWEKVPDSKKSRATGISISIGTTTSRPSSSTSITAQSSQAVQTKRQRQNAKKKEAAKSLKAAEEAERLGRLSSHKRQQERLKMSAQSNTTNKAGDISPLKPKSQTTGGGMKAVIGEDGRLVWE